MHIYPFYISLRVVIFFFILQFEIYFLYSTSSANRHKNLISFYRDQLIEHLQHELSGSQNFILQLKRKIISLEEQLAEKVCW